MTTTVEQRRERLRREIAAERAVCDTLRRRADLGHINQRELAAVLAAGDRRVERLTKQLDRLDAGGSRVCRT